MSHPRRALPSSSLCLAIGIVALLIALVTGIVAMGDRVPPGDLRIATSIQRAEGSVATLLATIGNTVGWTPWAGLGMIAVMLGAALFRARQDVIFLGILVVLRLAAIPLKWVFVSPRPTEDVLSVSGIFNGYGFPSGHSLTAATLCLGLAVLAWRHIPSRGMAVGTVVALLGLMLLVGWSRVWVGAHWPSDVVGGFSFGVVVVAIGVIAVQHPAVEAFGIEAERFVDRLPLPRLGRTRGV